MDEKRRAKKLKLGTTVYKKWMVLMCTKRVR